LSNDFKKINGSGVIIIIFAGVDIGSTTSKCILIDENKETLAFHINFTGFDRNESGEKVLKDALMKCNKTSDDIGYIVSTGYGRKAFERANKDIPEIIAHAVGTVQITPIVRTIIDIGGQDSKVIEIDEKGLVSRFEMNDKCAAGTGRFFEVLTGRLLGIDMDELSDLMLKATKPCTISSMCTIFAESEIISYLSQGVPKEDIAAGMSLSIVRRIIGMGKAGQMKFKEPIVFTGGVAKNPAIIKNFSDLLEKPVMTIDIPQSTAAMGAALTAINLYEKEVAKANV